MKNKLKNKMKKTKWRTNMRNSDGKKKPEQRRPSMAVFPAKEYRQKAAATASITASVVPVVHYATSVTTA